MRWPLTRSATALRYIAALAVVGLAIVGALLVFGAPLWLGLWLLGVNVGAKGTLGLGILAAYLTLLTRR